MAHYCTRLLKNCFALHLNFTKQNAVGEECTAVDVLCTSGREGNDTNLGIGFEKQMHSVNSAAFKGKN